MTVGQAAFRTALGALALVSGTFVGALYMGNTEKWFALVKTIGDSIGF